VDIESVADELYGLPLDEFTPARTDREKEARSAGDKDLAGQIHRLAKPNLVAWLANQLARARADSIRPLTELGDALREATAAASGPQLRALSRQQRLLVEALVRQACQLAESAGRQVSQDTARSLEDTLRAALADPSAAAALTAGRLTKGMQNSGLAGPVSPDRNRTGLAPEAPPAKGPEAPSSAGPSPTAPPRIREQRARAEVDVAQARRAADQAITARNRGEDHLAAANRTLARAEGRVAQVRNALDAALQAKSGAERGQVLAQAAFERADRTAREAEQRLLEATERRDR